MAELDAAAQLDRDAKVQSEILSTNILYETQSEILDLLLNRVAEIDSEGRLDHNIAYVDIATDSGVRNPLPFKEQILEMYFIMAERKRWDIFVVSHREKETCVRLKGKILGRAGLALVVLLLFIYPFFFPMSRQICVSFDEIRNWRSRVEKRFFDLECTKPRQDCRQTAFQV